MNKNFDAKNWLRNQYPLTILADRYGGTYSGGAFTAWPLLPDQVPDQAWGSDIDCFCFVKGNEYIIGVGEDPMKAFIDLTKKIEKKAKISKKQVDEEENKRISDALRYSEI